MISSLSRSLAEDDVVSTVVVVIGGGVCLFDGGKGDGERDVLVEDDISDCGGEGGREGGGESDLGVDEDARGGI